MLTLPIVIGKSYRRRDGIVVVAKLPREKLDQKRLALVSTGDEYDCTDSHVLLETGQSCYECATAKRRETQFDLIADAEEKPAGNPHAALILQYAQDWIETDKPWELWESFVPGFQWIPLVDHPKWFESHQYRRKPRTIKIGDCEIQAPERVAPADGTTCWTVAISCGKFIREGFEWDGNSTQKTLLVSGLVHLTKESAEAHASALIALTSLK